MALRLKKVTTPYGAVYENVYFKVHSVAYDDTDGILYFSCQAWLNEDAKNKGLQFLPELQFNFNFHSANKLGNWWQEAYEFIKKETARIEGYTLEEAEEYNQKRLYECMEKDVEPTEMLIKELLDFVGYEDC